MLLCGWLSRRVRGGKEGLRSGWPGPVQSMRFCAKPEAEERERETVCFFRRVLLPFCAPLGCAYADYVGMNTLLCRKREWACISFVSEALLRRDEMLPRSPFVSE